MPRGPTQRMVTLAMAVLDSAAYRSSTSKVDTLEVRLALAVLWCVLSERRWLRAYWWRANNVSGKPWVSCRGSWYGIAQTLRAEGWQAPVGYDWLRVQDGIAATPPPKDPGIDDA